MARCAWWPAEHVGSSSNPRALGLSQHMPMGTPSHVASGWATSSSAKTTFLQYISCWNLNSGWFVPMMKQPHTLPTSTTLDPTIPLTPNLNPTDRNARAHRAPLGTFPHRHLPLGTHFRISGVSHHGGGY
mmetsp:Transcript_43109/g.77463  ORF Transcript_43109/g.77463 Transcript_43109/m.77463 type:complete len:130 (+) Transcript_43109:3096-3485(+)